MKGYGPAWLVMKRSQRCVATTSVDRYPRAKDNKKYDGCLLLDGEGDCADSGDCA